MYKSESLFGFSYKNRKICYCRYFSKNLRDQRLLNTEIVETVPDGYLKYTRYDFISGYFCKL